jgi:hypothetical protein
MKFPLQHYKYVVCKGYFCIHSHLLFLAFLLAWSYIVAGNTCVAGYDAESIVIPTRRDFCVDALRVYPVPAAGGGCPVRYGNLLRNVTG